MSSKSSHACSFHTSDTTTDNSDFLYYICFSNIIMIFHSTTWI